MKDKIRTGEKKLGQLEDDVSVLNGEMKDQSANMEKGGHSSRRRSAAAGGVNRRTKPQSAATVSGLPRHPKGW